MHLEQKSRVSSSSEMATLTLLMSIAAVLSLCMTAVLGYSSGVPEQGDACKSMRPGHRTVKGQESPLIDAQDGTPWYTITVSKDEGVKAGEEVEVTIKTTSQANYIGGFFIQARHADTETALKGENKFGTWKVTDANTQALRCEGQAASHNNMKKPDGSYTQLDNVTLHWTAPSGTELKDVAFWATVLKDYDEFFMFVRSPILNASGAPHLVAPSIVLLVITSVLALLN